MITGLSVSCFPTSEANPAPNPDPAPVLPVAPQIPVPVPPVFNASSPAPIKKATAATAAAIHAAIKILPITFEIKSVLLLAHSCTKS